MILKRITSLLFDLFFVLFVTGVFLFWLALIIYILDLPKIILIILGVFVFIWQLADYYDPTTKD